jgi:hypothetical protein
MSTDAETGRFREPQKFSLKQRLPLAFLLFSLTALQGAPLATLAAPDVEKSPTATLFDDTLQAIKKEKKERLIVAVKKGEINDFIEKANKLDSSINPNAPVSFIDSTIPEIDTLVLTVSNKEEAKFVFTDPLIENIEEDSVTEVFPFVTNLNTVEHRLNRFSNSGLTGKGHRIAMGWFLDGRVSAVLGTHTHVPTSDQWVMPKGTAFVTDVGMCGSRNSVIGVKVENVVSRFTGSKWLPMEPAEEGPVGVNAVLIEIQDTTAKNITRLYTQY